MKADTTGILAQLQDKDGKFSNVKRYGIKINKADSNPDTRITYLYDAAGFTPAKMNFTDGSFDFGSWGEVFFIKQNRPVMLKADRTVAYELNHTDHSKKLDGTASDVGDASTTLNAMSEFPLMWLCQYEVGNYEYIIVSDTRVDSNYNADAYTREDGSVADHMYMLCTAAAMTARSFAACQERNWTATRTRRQRSAGQQQTEQAGRSSHGAEET